MFELNGWILSGDTVPQHWDRIMPSIQLSDLKDNIVIYQEPKFFHYHRVGDTWLRATWVGDAPRKAIENRLIDVRKQIDREHSTTPRKRRLREERAALLERLDSKDIAAPGYISACQFEIVDPSGEAGWVACDRENPQYLQACIEMETKLQVVVTLPAPEEEKYKGFLEHHYVWQLQQMLEIAEVFNKPAALTHKDWYTALLSVVSLPLYPLSYAQQEAIEPLQEFMKLAYVDHFHALQKLKPTADKNSFSVIYKYLYWEILQQIPSRYKKEMLPRDIDPALEVLPVGDLELYKPSSSDYQDGFLKASPYTEAFRILVQEFMRYRIEMKDDRDVPRVENDYDVMSYGVPTLRKALVLLNDERLTAAHMSLMKAKVKLEGEVFETMFADFKPQLIENLIERIRDLEILVQTATSRDPLKDHFICKPEDFTALMNSVDFLDERLLFRHPQFLAIEGREIEAAGILLEGMENYAKFFEKTPSEYLRVFGCADLSANIAIARFWLGRVNDEWEGALKHNWFNRILSKAIAENDTVAVNWLITKYPSQQVALMNLLCSEHLALANPTTGHAKRFFYLAFFLEDMSNSQRALTMRRVLREAAKPDVPLEALPMLYLCHKKMGDDIGPVFASGFMYQFAARSLEDIVKFCSGFNSVDDRMEYLCQPAIRYKLTLKDIQGLVVASSPAEVFANILIIKRLRLLLVDEASINMFEEHMQSHQNEYQKCNSEIKSSLRIPLIIAYTEVAGRQSQVQQSGQLMTHLWPRQTRVPLDVRLRHFKDRIDRIFDPRLASFAINRSDFRPN